MPGRNSEAAVTVVCPSEDLSHEHALANPLPTDDHGAQNGASRAGGERSAVVELGRSAWTGGAMLAGLDDPILRDPPLPILTERLMIRPAQAGDGVAFSEAVGESRADLIGFLDWALTAPTGDRAEIFMRKRGIAFAQRFELPLYTFDRETGVFVGECGLYGIDWALPKFGLGYWCRSTRTGQGLTAEAVTAVTAWAFEHFDAVRVELGCFESNLGSRRVAEKCGFTFEGVFRLGRRRPDGVAEDRYNFAIVR